MSLDDLVFGKAVASDVGQWKVPLQQAHDPAFLMPLVLHVFAEPAKGRRLICLTPAVYPGTFVCYVDYLFVDLFETAITADTLSALPSQSFVNVLLVILLQVAVEQRNWACASNSAWPYSPESQRQDSCKGRGAAGQCWPSKFACEEIDFS